LTSAHAIAIRTIRPDEWQSYRSFRLQALADSPNAFATTLEQASTWSDHDWQRRFSSPSAEREFPVVAEIGGQFIGMAWAQVDPAKKTARLFQMWVVPAHRARGVGQKLLAAATEWAKSQGAREIVLGVTCGNSPARRLYESAGFNVVGSLEPLRPTSELMVQNMALAL
jgi:ribosomal protein S18 acetylase RimI-like enzyme